MQTNEITDNVTQYFKFENEFASALECDSLEDENTGLVDWVITFNPPVTDSDHIKDDGTGNKIITTSGGVLLAKVSFQLISDEFDISDFALKEDEFVPTTGIKINLNVKDSIENKSAFRFVDATASKNADLDNLIMSSGTTDEENQDNSTYKEYELNPKFDKDTLSYELELLENVDELNLKPILSDAKSSMKLRKPKRSEDGNLVYESDGTTIEYEEIDIQNNISIPVKLNELGKGDTNLTITVTAEDGKTQKIYTVVVKRPYATITGKTILADFDNEDVVNNVFDVYGVQLENRADINIYEADLIEWESIPDIYGSTYEDPFTYEKIENISKKFEYTTKNDGTFEIYITPGKFDIQITRLGFLDYIYSDVIVNSGDIIDIGDIRLVAGDSNRDGVISQEDVNTTKKYMDIDNTSSEFKLQYNPSQIGTVVAEDLAYVKGNQDKEIKIEYFK